MSYVMFFLNINILFCMRVCLYSPAPAFSIHDLQYSVCLLEKVLSLVHLDFEKNRNGAIEIFRGLGKKVNHGKKPKAKNLATLSLQGF
jgi:hypothetical protein